MKTFGNIPPRSMPYAAAMLLTLVATVLTLLVLSVSPSSAGASRQPPPTALFFAAIVLSTWWGGLGSGLLATALSTLVIEYAIFLPNGYAPWTSHSFIRVGAFTLIALLIESLNMARFRAERALKERTELAVFSAQIARGLVASDSLATLLRDSANAIVSHLNVWSAAIWMPEGEQDREHCWRVRASAGERYSSETAKPLAAHSFPLVVGERALGRLILWNRDPISAEGIRTLEEVSQEIALGIDRWQALAALEEQTNALAAALKEAEEAVQSKTEFVASVSHELKTPLNGIIGLTRILLDTELSTEQRQMASGVREAGRALLTVINDLLDLASQEAGKISMDPASFDLRHVVEQALELMAPGAQEKGISLLLRYSPEAPQFLWGDAGRIRQIILNLVGNAIKFTHEGHVLVDVECGNKNALVPLIEIMVQDTGIGIAADNREAIFGRYNQGSATTRKDYGGTGLGLAICRQLAAMMGGEVRVESRVGVGSTFTVTLRLPRVAVPEDRSAETRYTELRGTPILVAEANAINRGILAEQLVSWEMEVATYGTGREALQALTDASNDVPFPVALIDSNLSDMDYAAFADAVTSHPALQLTKLVLLAPIVRAERLARQAKESGYHSLLTKPVRPSQLMDTIAEAVYSPLKQSPESTFINGMEIIVPGAWGRVLVVDDNIVNQGITRRDLEAMGCQVDLAANGAEAVRAVQAREYALVIMDCQMPEMDGFEATVIIRRGEAEMHRDSPEERTPIIALTADATLVTRERCLAAGMDDVLGKPLDPASLRKAVLKWARLPETADPREVAEPTPSMPVLIPPADAKTEAREADAPPSRFRGDPEGLALAATLFLEEAPRLLHRLEGAVSNRKWDEIARAAHAVKGVAMYFEAEGIIGAARHLEFAARSCEAAAVDEAAAALRREMDSFVSLMERNAFAHSG